MNDPFAPDSDTNGPEPLDKRGTWLLDLVAAVDHLRRGHRPASPSGTHSPRQSNGQQQSR